MHGWLQSSEHSRVGETTRRCPSWCTHVHAPLREEVGDGLWHGPAPTIGDRIAEAWVLGPRVARSARVDVHDGWAVRTAMPVTIELLGRGHRGEDLERFALKGRVLARIRHHNALRMVGRGVDRGQPFIVLERVEGRTLVGAEPWPIARALEVLQGVFDGLQAIHRAGVVHGDLHDGSVVACGDGRVVLGTLGCASPSCACRPWILPGRSARATAYLAPELMIGGAATIASDVYALAAFVYEIVTGTPPFGGTRAEIVDAALHGSAPPPSSLRVDLPRALDVALLRGLDRRIESRTPSVAALRHQLRDALRNGLPTTSPSALVAVAA